MQSTTENIQNPEDKYESPCELLKCSKLDPREKLEALDQWAFNVRSRVDAVSEGMTTRNDGSYTADVELLRDIERARELIEHAIATPPHALPAAENRSWVPGQKGQGAEGFSSGYGGSAGRGTGPSGPENKA